MPPQASERHGAIGCTKANATYRQESSLDTHVPPCHLCADIGFDHRRSEGSSYNNQ